MDERTTTPLTGPNYRRIILADDGSPVARSAVPRAAAVAQAVGGEMLVVRVSRAEGARAGDLSAEDWATYFTPAWDERAREAPLEAEPRLSEVVDDLRARGVSAAGSLVLHGDAGESLVDAAEALHVDLVVLSSRGEGGIRRAVLGSVAEHLVREARGVAVLLCPPPDEDAPEVPEAVQRLLVSLDGSDLSEAALPHAEYLAHALGAELVLIRVTDSEADLIAASMPTGTPPMATISAEQAQEAAQQQLAHAGEALRERASTVRGHGITTVGVEVATGDPATEILAAADRLGTDVIVMATHGRGGLGRLLLGSVADAVSRQSERAAVLLVRSTGED